MTSALWSYDGTDISEVACSTFSNWANDITVSYSGLIPGKTYYISVDSKGSGDRGTFSMCMNNAGDTYYSIANGDWKTPGTWSLVSHVGTPASSFPGIGDNVYIDGHSVTVTGTDSASYLNINSTNGISSLNVSGDLSILGALDIVNAGSSNNIDLTISNGDLFVNDFMKFVRSGGSGSINWTTSGTSNITVNQYFLGSNTGGNTNNNSITFNGDSKVNIGGEFGLFQTSGVGTSLTLNDNANLTVFDAFVFSATADNILDVTLNNNSVIELYDGVTKGSPAYGSLTANDNSTVIYNSVTPTSNVASPSAVGTSDQFQYKNVVLNPANSSVTYTLSEDLEIEGYFELTKGTGVITSGLNFTVDGDIINNGTIIIENGATLIQNGAGTNNNSGTGTYEVDLVGNASNSDYNVFSSPFESLGKSSLISLGFNPCDIYTFAGNTQEWKYDYALGFNTSCLGNNVTFGANDIITGGDGILDQARGYYLPGISSSTILGGVNNGDISIPIYTTSVVTDPSWNGNDWNLVGNPYPSALDATAFWNENAVDNNRITDAIYFWDESDEDYASWNLTGGVSSGTGAIPNGSIGLGQGFWVVAATNSNLQFDNSMRSSTNNQYFKTDLTPSANVWISFSSPNGNTNNILIGVNEAASNGYDALYDAHKLSGNWQIKFASVLNNEDFAIQAIEPIQIGKSRIIPLTVNSTDNGDHVISISKMENINPNYYYFLRDNKLNQIIDLRLNDYSVPLTSSEDNTGRFELIITHQLSELDDKNSSVTSTNELRKSQYVLLRDGQNFILTNSEGVNGNVRIIDISGRLVKEYQNIMGTQITFDLSNQPSGIFILEVFNETEKLYHNKLVK